jgi:hypothetical protein
MPQVQNPAPDIGRQIEVRQVTLAERHEIKPGNARPAGAIARQNTE